MNNKNNRGRELVSTLLAENPNYADILTNPEISVEEGIQQLRERILIQFQEHPKAFAYYNGTEEGEKAFFKLSWRDFSFIRILDYLEHEGESFPDPNNNDTQVLSRPFSILREAALGNDIHGSDDLFEDFLNLLRQVNGTTRPTIPSRKDVLEWMERHPSGLDSEVINRRRKNRKRIIKLLVPRIKREIKEVVHKPADSEKAGNRQKKRFTVSTEMSDRIVREKIEHWWNNDLFQLQHAVKTPEDLQLFLDNSLSKETMQIMKKAESKGIPFFVTPYFLSLLDTIPGSRTGFADQVIRDYVLYSPELVDEFGKIRAWEKEDLVEPGKPNEAGWLLPSHNIHRRYPNVAIFIPSTMGRACGGLCAYCQRMYDFQNGRLNFNLEKLRPAVSWGTELNNLMKYFENDSQLKDILITGGDAMMSSVSSLENILDAVYDMAKRKIEANRLRNDGEKYAEIVRVRLGTKIPIYLPQRINKRRVAVLKQFREKASEIGIRQFIIQTHFSTAMEVTPEAKIAVEKLLAAGWTVTNQEVFTLSASRRGHSAKLRQVLNDIGVLPYYTFTVKGYMENSYFFANNSRSIQEQIEEKSIGRVDPKYYSRIRSFMKTAEDMKEQINEIRDAEVIPFLATDRNTINLPGVGKSNIYRTIGITDDGRRILAFKQDHSRPHSPKMDSMGDIIIIESKSIAQYLRQIEQIGENIAEYESIWGYSAGYIEPRIPIYEYPGYQFRVTEKFTNLVLTTP
ncbi:MAG: KamA family protein [Spirochaetia bacterium]|nr:KamA family protein [Spirochaetia bacterium]